MSLHVEDVFRIVWRGRKSEQDKRGRVGPSDGLRTRWAMKVAGPVVTCPSYYLGLRGCGQTFTARRYYGAEDRLVLCPYCGLFFPQDLP